VHDALPILTTVAVGVLTSLHHRLFGDAIDVFTTAAVTLGLGKDFLVTSAGCYTTFNARHCGLLSSVRKHGANQLFIGSMNFGHAAQLTLRLGRFLGQDVALERLGPLDPTTRAHLESLLGAALGLHLGHC